MQKMLQEQYAQGVKQEAAVNGGSATAASASSKDPATPQQQAPTKEASPTSGGEDKKNINAKDGELKVDESRSKSRGRGRKSRSPRRRGAAKERSTSSTRSLEELNKNNINARVNGRNPSKKRQASHEGEDAPPHVSRQMPEINLNVADVHAPAVSA